MKKDKRPSIARHKHRWAVMSHRGAYVTKRCNIKGCDIIMPEQKMTPSELRKHKIEQSKLRERSNQIHKIFWDFGRTFYKFKKVEVSKELRQKYPTMYTSKYQDVRDGWKWKSYDLMQRIEKWAEKYPKDVQVCRIDDSFFASSSLVMITHRVGNKIFGTSIVVVTQCDGQPPCEFFVYPSHREGIQEALAKISKFKSIY